MSRPTPPIRTLSASSQNKLTANRLTVTFQNGNSIGVNTDGYVFVNGSARAIKSGDGRNLYHDLFVLSPSYGEGVTEYEKLTASMVLSLLLAFGTLDWLCRSNRHHRR